MEREDIIAVVEEAGRRLIGEERELLDRHVSERALTHHFARFLRDGVPSPYVVDVEYNRHRDDPKRLQLSPTNAPDHELRPTPVFPDVIVHVRGTDEYNLLVLEIKKPGEDLAHDQAKLRAFREQLNYQYAGHVVLGIDKAGRLIHKLIWVD